MIKRIYPCINQGKPENKRAQEGTGKPCIVCGRMTTGIRFVQVWHMRGDDVDVRSCDAHKNDEVLAAYKAQFTKATHA